MKPLGDPCNDRVNKAVVPPPHLPLAVQKMYKDNGDMPNWRLIRDHLKAQGRIQKKLFKRLIKDCNKILCQQIIISKLIKYFSDLRSNNNRRRYPWVILSNRQFYDLLKILQIGGNPQQNKYLFLGDYVDRGSFSVQIIILLYSLKINYPKIIQLIRGNHECRHMTSFFNFREQCLYKYDQQIYDLIMDSFDALPISAIINNKFFCIHGGLSPQLKTLEDIKKFNRTLEPPKYGLMCDLLWSDPVDNKDGSILQSGHSEQPFRFNQTRGCSYIFGYQSTRNFIDKNKLISVIRAHQAQPEGFKMYKWSGPKEFPCVITIFSAPNYCDVYNNKGAVIKFKHSTLNIQQYNYSNHPYLLPNFLDLLSWSLPFVAQKVTEMFYNLLKTQQNAKIQEEDQSQINLMTDQRKINIKNKIIVLSKLMKMQKTLRQENQAILQLKGYCPDNKIPKGLLIQGKEGIENAIVMFEKAKSSDLINQKRPQL